MWRENEEGRFIHYGAAFFIRIINLYNYINILYIIVMVLPLKLLDAFGCSWLSGDMFKRKTAKSGKRESWFRVFRVCLAMGAKKGYNTRQGNENNIYISIKISEDGTK